MPKTLLVVGSNSFIAKGVSEFLESSGYQLYHTTRKNLDIENEKSIVDFLSGMKDIVFDGIIFCQGLNPSTNAKDSNADHILKMFSVNIAGPILLMKHICKHLNSNASVIFFSSIAASKGSYDPAYSASKSAIYGLMQSLANEFNTVRFNGLALGLVEGSPVYNQMTPDFREKHIQRMFGGKLITIENISTALVELLHNNNINRSIMPLTGGYIV